MSCLSLGKKQNLWSERYTQLEWKRGSAIGPNFCWHVDGYDKLKPFVFPIHGAVDGYSHIMMWLKVDRTNNDPEITAKFFTDWVEEVGWCPSLLQTDCGTENVVIAGTQCFLRADCNDDLAGEKSHRYGPSTGNQRIEAWWAYLRRSHLTWWINFFKDLVDRGVFLTGDVLHGVCIWFCFAELIELIQHDLDFVKFHWNTLYIRHSRETRGTLLSSRKLWSLKPLTPSVPWIARWSKAEM